jgi:hypothetical protein
VAIQPSYRRQQWPFNHLTGGNRGHSTILQETTVAIQPSCRRKQGPFNHPAGGNWGHSTILQESTGDIQPTRGNRVHSPNQQEATRAIQLSCRRQHGSFNHSAGGNCGHPTILRSQQGPSNLKEATGAIHLTSSRQLGPFNHPAGDNWGHSTILRSHRGHTFNKRQ